MTTNHPNSDGRHRRFGGPRPARNWWPVIGIAYALAVAWFLWIR